MKNLALKESTVSLFSRHMRQRVLERIAGLRGLHGDLSPRFFRLGRGCSFVWSLRLVRLVSPHQRTALCRRGERSRTTRCINNIYPWTTHVRLSYFKTWRSPTLPCRVAGNFVYAGADFEGGLCKNARKKLLILVRRVAPPGYFVNVCRAIRNFKGKCGDLTRLDINENKRDSCDFV